jgi:hypothetical protein
MMIRSVFTAILLLSLTACVSVTPQAEGVKIVRNANTVRDCTSLGEMESTSHWHGGAGTAAGLANNKAALRNETAARGGDTLLILQEQASFYFPHTYAEAYRCGARKP